MTVWDGTVASLLGAVVGGAASLMGTKWVLSDQAKRGERQRTDEAMIEVKVAANRLIVRMARTPSRAEIEQLAEELLLQAVMASVHDDALGVGPARLLRDVTTEFLRALMGWLQVHDGDPVVARESLGGWAGTLAALASAWLGNLELDTMTIEGLMVLQDDPDKTVHLD